MKNAFFSCGLLYLILLLALGCRQKGSERIQFEVSQGVINGMNFAPLGMQTGDSLDSLRLYTLQG
jgi:hypothetical protein